MCVCVTRQFGVGLERVRCVRVLCVACVNRFLVWRVLMGLFFGHHPPAEAGTARRPFPPVARLKKNRFFKGVVVDRLFLVVVFCTLLCLWVVLCLACT